MSKTMIAIESNPQEQAEESLESTFEIKLGDCLQSLKQMPDQSVHCCVTSPPYFALRNYGVEGQIGLEQTPEQYIGKMVEVFREVRRVLRDDGTVWLNLGDSYAGAGYSNHANTGGDQRSDGGKQRHLSKTGVKNKDLIGIPWRVAFALQADGWYLRQDIIWHKPNPMPESVKDRCTKAHEYLFLLSKRERYYFDAEAISEPCSDDMQRRAAAGHTRGANGKLDASRCDADTMRGEHAKAIDVSKGRNKRSVWTVATRPYKGAHFATFPPTLIEPCILAGSRPGNIVLDPFGGSGTTAGVALAHGRNAILCELNPDYADLVPDRIESILSSYRKKPAR